MKIRKDIESGFGFDPVAIWPRLTCSEVWGFTVIHLNMMIGLTTDNMPLMTNYNDSDAEENRETLLGWLSEENRVIMVRMP